MKKFFLSICFSLIFVVQVGAATREFSAVEKVKTNTENRNKQILRQVNEGENLPKNDDEMLEFLRQRLEVVDFSVLSEGDSIDKMSSFSSVDDGSVTPKKTFWEKMYDDAIARVSGEKATEKLKLNNATYYSLQEQEKEEIVAQDNVPVINVRFPNGKELKAPAYEHIPEYITKIEVLPTGVLKIVEDVTIVANGNKVQEGLVRFIKKKSSQGKNNVKVILNEVRINDEIVPYELAEQKDYFMLRPEKNFRLPEGVYVFRFNYLLDRSLWDMGDYFEFYWDLTGGYINLLVNKAILVVKLPGREPSVKRFVLTGKAGKLADNEAVVLEGGKNTLGFISLRPLLSNESMHVFLTIPKVDFLPINSSRKILWHLEDSGDVLLSLMFLVIIGTASILSWRYVKKNMKFKNINIMSPLVVRSLWRGGADNKSVGCVLLDLFRKNIIDIQSRNGGVILVRKSSHSRNVSRFENKFLKVLFATKDNICKLSEFKQMNKLSELVGAQSKMLVNLLAIRMSNIYWMFSAFMLLVVEVALALWSDNQLALKLMLIADVFMILAIAGYCLYGKYWWRKALALVLMLGALLGVISVLSVCLSWLSVVMLLLGVACAVIFCKRILSRDAILKNAVKAVYNMRDFLEEQKENIGSGRNFVVQQANIFALDLEDKYEINDKIKSVYRLDDVQKVMRRVF